MKKLFVFVLLGGFVLPSASWAIDLKQAKFTQVVNSVDVISQSAQGRHAAAVNDVFTMPDVLRTGPDSRAELIADDKTITRVGANTVFSYDPASRTIDLQQGSLLFHSPHGKGGGTIHTGSATASVLGTTIIVTCTPNGGFKLLDLEGQAEIKFLNGLQQTLQPGQMTFALQGGGTSPVIVFRLDSQTKGSTLVSGFATPLPSAGKINAEVTRQLLQILNNNAQDTGLVVGNNATPDSVQVVQNINNQNQPTPFDAGSSIVGPHGVSTLPISYNPSANPPVTLNSAQIETPITLPDNIANAVTLQTELALLNIGAPPVGFVGDNIDIDTGLCTPIDLSAYASDDPNHPNFEILAANDLRIWQSAKFTGMSGADDTIGLIAGGKMLIAQNSQLEADTGNFDLAADSFGVLDTSTGLEEMNPDAPLNPEYLNELLDVSVINNGGGVDIQSVSSLKIESGIYNAGNGDLNVIAGGNIYIDSATLEASSLSSVSQNGSVYITGTGYVEIYDSSVSGDGDVNIESGGTLTLNAEGSDTIEAGGSVYLTSDYADVNIYDYNIYADNGSVSINAEGSVYLSDNDIEAGSEADTAYDMNINSYGSTIDIEDTYISATGDVNIESWGALTLGNDSSDEIDANGSINLKSDTGDVYVDYDLYAGGNVNITSGSVGSGVGGNVEVEDSTVEAGYDYYPYTGGNVNINAYNGNVTLIGDDVEAYSGDSSETGYVNVYGSGTVDVEDTYIYADNDVNIESGGTLTLNAEGSDTIEAGGSVYLTSDYADVNIYDYNIYADNGSVSINGEGSVYLSDSDIEAGYDTDTAYDININSYDSTIDIEDTYISATGDVNIESWGALTLGNDSSDEIDANGSINLKSDTGDVYVDYDLYAGGNVNITSGSVGSGVGGNIEVEDSTVEAGYDYYPYTGGNVNINAYNGNVTLIGDDVEAYSGDSSETGYVNVYGSGTVDVEDTYIYADNDVNIESGGTLTLNAEGSDTIEAGGSVYLASDYADVNIYGYNIYADYGSVSINGEGSVYLSGSDIEAGYDADTAYDMNINSYDSTVDIDNTYLYASGNVNIESSDTLTVENSTEIDSYGSDGISLTSDYADVDVYDSYLYAYDGDINISAGRNIDIENSDIEQDGSVYADAGGSVYLYDVYYGENSSDTYLTDWTINAGTYVHIGADENVQIYGSEINANGGDVDITGDGDVVSIYSSTISASGNVDIESGGTLNIGTDPSFDDTITAGYDVTLSAITDIYIYDTGITAGVNYGNVNMSGGTYVYSSDPDISTSGGDVSISAGGEADIGYSTIDLQGNISISGSGITTDDGSVTISTGGEADLSGDAIYIMDSSITGNNISISDSTVTANNGNVNIYNYGSASFNAVSSSTISGSTISLNNIDISDSTVTANGGDVNIKSYGDQSIQLGSEPDVSDSSIAVGDISISDSSYIYASGDVNITSGGSVSRIFGSSGNIDIEGSDVYAGYDYNNEQPSLSGGSVNIHAYDGNVYLCNDDIEANIGESTASESGNGNVNISGQTISAANGENEVISTVGGSIYISALNNVNIFNTTFDVGGGISISGSRITTTDSDVDITSGGMLCISAGGTVNISGSDVLAGNIDISGSSIAANGGSVNIDNNGSISFASDFDSAGQILIDEASYITAIEGNVNIGSIGGVDFENSTVAASGTGGETGNITVSAGAGITVNGSTVNADTGAGTIALNSTAGQTTIQNSSMQAFYINVNSPDGILLDGTGGGRVNANTMNLTAGMGDASGGPTATIQNQDLSNLKIVNVRSHTANFDNDNFSSGSSYNVTVWNHDYHINDGHVVGSANFNNDTLNGSTLIVNTGTAGLANQSNNGGIVLGGSGAGIHIN